MNTMLKIAMASMAIALFAGCEADGGFPGGGGGGGGGGDGGIAPGTDISGYIPASRGGGTGTGSTTGFICDGAAQFPAGGDCRADNPELVTDGDEATSGILTVPLGLLGTTTGAASFLVDLGQTVQPGGNTVAAFEVEDISSLVDAGVLRALTINTYAAGELVETFDGSGSLLGLLDVDLVGQQLDTSGRFLAGGVPTAAFDAIEIILTATVLTADVDSLLGLENSLLVHDVVTEAMAP